MLPVSRMHAKVQIAWLRLLTGRFSRRTLDPGLSGRRGQAVCLELRRLARIGAEGRSSRPPVRWDGKGALSQILGYGTVSMALRRMTWLDTVRIPIRR